MRIFLGIDGGQTATKSILADETGRVLAAGTGGPVTHVKDGESREQARRAIDESVHQVLEFAGLPDSTEIDSAFLGFSGVAGPEVPAAQVYREVTEEQFAIKTITIDHDAHSALAGALPSMRGVIVIAGTGSIAFGMDPFGNCARAGGWGYLLGDPGSGYEIGRQAIAAVGRAHDGIGPATALTAAILRALETSDVAAITRVIYRDPAPKLRIASVSSVAAEAARSGDPIALAIFVEAGRGLGELACAVSRKLRIPPAEILFSAVGGVFQAGEIIWQPYREFVLSKYPEGKVVEPEFPAVVGALIIAFNRKGISISGERLTRLAQSYDQWNRQSKNRGDKV
jgi:N-acetylglucosamine kinase-like BadF-type ATPase